MKRYPWVVLAMLLGVGACSDSAYLVSVVSRKGGMTANVALLMLQVQRQDEDLIAGQIGEPLCLIATVSLGNISCFGKQCSLEDSGRKVATAIPGIAPRYSYLQYTAPTMTPENDILGVSLYQTDNCTLLDKQVPILTRVCFITSISADSAKSCGELM